MNEKVGKIRTFVTLINLSYCPKLWPQLVSPLYCETWNFNFYLDIFESYRAPKVYLWVPCSYQLCFPSNEKGPQSASYFINQSSYTPPGPQPNGLHFMAGLWNYSNKSITSACRNKGILQPLVTSNLASHNPYNFIPPWSATLMGPYMACVGSPSPGCEYIQLTKYCQSYLPSTGCCLGKGSLLHLWCEYEMIKKPTQEHKRPSLNRTLSLWHALVALACPTGVHIPLHSL